MRWPWRACWFVIVPVLAGTAWAADGNRLSYLDDFCDPYYAGLDTAKLVTPQWIGEEGVEAACVLSIDDLVDTARYETFLRPILQRLKQIDGRAPLSIMTQHVDPHDPLLERWLQEGVSLEAHTYDHPCPCLQGGGFEMAKGTYDRCLDALAATPAGRAVAFRMPCCDSMNSASPRFFSEIFHKTTAQGNFAALDSSVLQLFTADDPRLPRNLAMQEDLQPRFAKYLPLDRKFVNYVENYPYPYVIDRLCWELPIALPDDWQGFHFQGAHSPLTVRDMKASLDATVLKQGIFVLTFHPGAWIHNEQVVELIDYAAKQYGKKVKFLNFREVYARLTQNLLGGQPLRSADGQDNGVRVLDLNHDGYMDVVIGNEKLHQTRIWSPEKRQWTSDDFPADIVSADGRGGRQPSGVRFGVLQKNGCASLLVRNEKVAGLWHFDLGRWLADPQGLAGLELASPVATSLGGRDQGVRLRDLDRDGVCELIVGNPRQQGVFQWLTEQHAWKTLPFTLPAGATIVDAQGRDAGCRLVDIDEDGHPDVVFSNADRYSLDVFISMIEGWSRKIVEAKRSGGNVIPMIVRADGTNNGVWFKYRHLWIQNEDAGELASFDGRPVRLPAEGRFYTALLSGDIHPPPRSPEDSLRSVRLRPGMKADLAAAEPLVMDPIDIAWGPDGKAWVVEMTDYPLGLDDKGKPGGRVRLLEDTDGDGIYDKSTVFLEGIGFPTGIMPWRKGVIVTTAPEIFYAEDTDGDGKADYRRALYSGFREGNQQHRVNHPRWGLDNWVYLANGDSGGEIKSTKTGDVLNISGRDLRIRPDEGLLDAESGQSQYGRNRDDWGNWFGCSNNNAGWYYAMVDHYIRRNPHVAAPSGRANLSPSRLCWPAGRVITHCYIPQPTPPEGHPMSWTCVCGIMIYRDELLGPELAGNAFLSDGVYNTVHRALVSPQGALFKSTRAPDEQHSEFFNSVDPWCRPTTLRTGPDGALWVVDMYRFVIEHPEWIESTLVKSLNLREGHDKGRIYRLYPVDKKPRPIPRLDKLDTAGLVAALDSPNGWQRDMAQQMLIWRGDRAAAGPLEEMVLHHQRALARLHALCTLDGLSLLRPNIVVHALADEQPGVRRHAIRLSEPLVNFSIPLGEALLKRADDPDPQVQMQLAYSLGEWHDPRAGQLLGKLAIRHAGDPYLTAAVMSSAVPHVQQMLAEAQSNTTEPQIRTTLIRKLEKLAADIQARPDLTAAKAGAKFGLALRRPPEPNRQRTEKVLGRAATMAQVQATLDKYSPVLNMFGDPDRGKKVFVEATCTTCHRCQGLGEEIGPDLETLVDRSPQTLLVAVCDPNRAVLERFIEYIAITGDGQTINGMLLEESSNSVTLVDRDAKRHVILRKDLDELIYTGRSHMPEGLADKMTLEQMADLFAFIGGKGPPPKQFAGNMPELIRLNSDLTLVLAAAKAEIYGDAITYDTRQNAVTNWTCAAASTVWWVRVERMAEFEVWLAWACASETAGNPFEVQVNSQKIKAAVTGTGGAAQYREAKIGQVRLAPGTSRVTLRPGQPLSGALMNLRGLRLVRIEPPTTRPSIPRLSAQHNKPEQVRPAADGTLHLRAAQAEVHGPGMVFESKYGNLGCWYKSEAYGSWSVRIDRGGVYDVLLDWACDDGSAGSQFQVQVNQQILQARVPSTGSWDRYRQQKFGQLKLDPGVQQVIFRSAGPIKRALIDLRALHLVPITGQKK